MSEFYWKVIGFFLSGSLFFRVCQKFTGYGKAVFVRRLEIVLVNQYLTGNYGLTALCTCKKQIARLLLESLLASCFVQVCQKFYWIAERTFSFCFVCDWFSSKTAVNLPSNNKKYVLFSFLLFFC